VISENYEFCTGDSLKEDVLKLVCWPVAAATLTALEGEGTWEGGGGRVANPYPLTYNANPETKA
jgi:hypothetical protein